MGRKSAKDTVMTGGLALDFSCASLGWNETTRRLEQNPKEKELISVALRDMGITHLKPLTTKYSEGTIALPFYSGNGIVTKIIPSNYYDNTNPIYQLPPITSEVIKTDGASHYIIETYPWLPEGYNDQKAVNEVNTKMDNVGLTIIKGDDHPRNFRAMPDKEHTLTSIDSNTYINIGNGKEVSPALKDAWQEYVEELFPIYKQAKEGIQVTLQDENTDFSLFSIQNPDTDIVGFDHTHDDPIIREDPPEKPPPKKSIFKNFFSFPEP